MVQRNVKQKKYKENRKRSDWEEKKGGIRWRGEEWRREIGKEKLEEPNDTNNG